MVVVVMIVGPVSFELGCSLDLARCLIEVSEAIAVPIDGCWYCAHASICVVMLFLRHQTCHGMSGCSSKNILRMMIAACRSVSLNSYGMLKPSAPNDLPRDREK